MSRNRDTSLVAQNSGGTISPDVTGKNKIINGAFDIWQRGTDVTSYGYAVDRWYLDWVNPAYTAAVQGRLVRSTDVPSGFLYSTAWYSTAATAFLATTQAIESFNAAPLAGKTVTFSFYIKRIAAISGGLMSIRYDGGTSQDSFSGSIRDQAGADILVDVSTIPTSWTRYSITFTAPSSATNGMRLALFLRNISGITTSGQEILRFTGAQLELGSVATSFSRAAGTIQQELAACQRYYWRQTASQPYSIFSAPCNAYVANIVDGMYIQFPVSMRIPPATGSGAPLTTSGLCISDGATLYSGGTWTYSSVSQSTFGTGIKYQHTSSALTQWRTYQIAANNNASAYIEFNAEL